MSVSNLFVTVVCGVGGKVAGSSQLQQLPQKRHNVKVKRRGVPSLPVLWYWCPIPINTEEIICYSFSGSSLVQVICFQSHSQIPSALLDSGWVGGHEEREQKVGTICCYYKIQPDDYKRRLLATWTVNRSTWLDGQEIVPHSCFCYKMEWLLIGVRSVLIVIGTEDKGGDQTMEKNEEKEIEVLGSMVLF